MVPGCNILLLKEGDIWNVGMGPHSEAKEVKT